MHQGSLKDKTIKIFKHSTWDVKIALKQQHVNILSVFSFEQLRYAIPEYRNCNNMYGGAFVILKITCLK